MAVTAAAPPPVVARPPTGRVKLRTFRRDDVLLLAGSAVAAVALVWLVYEGLTIQAGTPGFVVWWYVAFLGIYWAAVYRMHGRLMARDRLATAVITSLTVIMLAPLLLIIGDVVYQGWSVISPHFFFDTIQFCGDLQPASCGGVGHAIVGTVEQVGIAMLIAVPLAILCAVFLSEIGGRLKRPVRLFVAGLFIYSVWNLALGHPFTGFGASLALSILMLPTVTRTGEEVLRLVPGGLREGALALGASEWRTVWHVVLPTARSGLITAVILGVARVVGETAPLILTSSGSAVMNASPFAPYQEALPHFVYQDIRGFNPGSGPYQRGWGAALVLIALVLLLFTFTRVLGARGSVEAKQRRAAKRLARSRAAARPTGGVA